MLWFLKRWRVHCDAHWETLRSRPPPSSTVFHFLQVAEVVNTAARNDVRLPGHRWLKPQEVQREDRAAQPEASRGDAGLRTADDRPHCFKGKYTTFHKLIILVIYVIISGYYVTSCLLGVWAASSADWDFWYSTRTSCFPFLRSASPRLSAWRRNENSLVGLQWYTNTNTLCRDLFVFWFHFDQRCNRKWESGSSAAQPPAKKAPWRCYKCWEWSSVVWEGCSMHVCRPAVYIHLLLSCWISSHELRPEVHPGHCSIYTHHCTGPVLLIIRSTDAQMSPRAKWVHMCFMFSVSDVW